MRAKCRVCGQSSAIGDGYCEFCGNALEIEQQDATLRGRAGRRAEETSGTADPPAHRRGTPGDAAAWIASVLAAICLFVPILGPIAIWRGAVAWRLVREEGRSSVAGIAALVVGSLATLLTLLLLVAALTGKAGFSFGGMELWVEIGE